MSVTVVAFMGREFLDILNGMPEAPAVGSLIPVVMDSDDDPKAFRVEEVHWSTVRQPSGGWEWWCFARVSPAGVRMQHLLPDISEAMGG